jgi:DNA-binding NarL/FixJ family response regulator
MNHSQGYILVIGELTCGDQIVPQRAPETAANTAPHAIEQTLCCPVVVVDSPEKAVAQAQVEHPYLVILSGDSNQSWSPQVARQIRQTIQPEGVVIVALTDSSELSWAAKPDGSEIDGFFVKPLSVDILSALNESAIAKKQCLQLT